MELLKKTKPPLPSHLRNEIQTEPLHLSQSVPSETIECPDSDEVVSETQVDDLNNAVNHLRAEYALQQSTPALSLSRNPACERNPQESISANFVFGEARKDFSKEIVATSKAPVSVGPIRADAKAKTEAILTSKTAQWCLLVSANSSQTIISLLFLC